MLLHGNIAIAIWDSAKLKMGKLILAVVVGFRQGNRIFKTYKFEKNRIKKPAGLSQPAGH